MRLSCQTNGFLVDVLRAFSFAAPSTNSYQEQTIMLVTPERNRRNRDQAFARAGGAAAVSFVAGWFFHPALLSLGLSPFIYWLVRRRWVRRLEVMGQPFPDSWEKVLQSHVAFFRSLPDPEKERFRQLVKVFLDEVRITGIETEVDDTVRVLVAASAAIPIFGFDDWEYHRLGEVLSTPAPSGRIIKPPEGPIRTWVAWSELGSYVV
jgi:MtfA peptidase